MRQDLQVWVGLDHGVLFANAGVLRQAQWKPKAYVGQRGKARVPMVLNLERLNVNCRQACIVDVLRNCQPTRCSTWHLIGLRC